MPDEQKSKDLKKEAEKVALDLIEHARETARQMLLNTNLDVSQIPRICDDIRKIKTDLTSNTIATERIQIDLAWLKWGFMGIAGGMGATFLTILIKSV